MPPAQPESHGDDRSGDAPHAGRVADLVSRLNEADRPDDADSLDGSSRGSHYDSSVAFDTGDSLADSSRLVDEDQPTLDPPDGSQRSESPSLSNPDPGIRNAPSSRATLISTPIYRPTRRPPMAVLRVYDDDGRDAEVCRIRQTPFIIGRQDGELVIGHERQMSRRHARIDRVQEGDQWHWYLGDLKSTNGTFHRVKETRLEHGTEVLIAGELVRFLEPASGSSAKLVKVGPTSEEERVVLTDGTYLIGADAKACLPFLRSAPYLDPYHFRLERRVGRWWIVDLASTNHLWVAIQERTELINNAMFQIGEQRFSFHLP